LLNDDEETLEQLKEIIEAHKAERQVLLQDIVQWLRNREQAKWDKIVQRMAFERKRGKSLED
jgi:IS5 family transposase